MIEGRPVFSPFDFERYKQQGNAARQGVDPSEAGPVTAETSDNELRARAARYGYQASSHAAFLPEYILRLERRIAALEAALDKEVPPQLRNIESR